MMMSICGRAGRRMSVDRMSVALGEQERQIVAGQSRE